MCSDFSEKRQVLKVMQRFIDSRELVSVSPVLYTWQARSKGLHSAHPGALPFGRELAALPTSTQEKSSLAGAKQLRRRWQYQQMLMRQLWKRWTEEYLVSLTVSGKSKKINRQPEIDDLVLVTEDTVPRNRWKTGVITELQPRSEGIVRSV
ncbi:hypothetical protein T12_7899 [Trichinella patagoniensis]|uniref:DUF5641 domain-containing protein n=1 Tax=Trichinella patagoniensis TaxID=990121 RepID=A0A0V0ZS18_9BILA|nr:hypothetical protein T12_7899 [Trichinella patagoniensis]